MIGNPKLNRINKMDQEILDFIEKHKQYDEYYEGDEYSWYMNEENVLELIKLVEKLAVKQN